MKAGLYIALIAFLSLQPSHAQAQERSVCAGKKDFQTAINVRVNEKPIKYIYHWSRARLTKQSAERTKQWKKQHKGHGWLSGGNVKLHTNGVAAGKLSMRSDMRYTGQPYDKYGAYYCPYFKEINVDLNYQTDIYIAREIKKGTCKFDAVMEHEMKHHHTNVTVVNTLAETIAVDLISMIEYMEQSYVTRENLDQTWERMSQGVSDMLDIYGEELSGRMSEFNDLVDTPEEYERVSKMCR